MSRAASPRSSPKSSLPEEKAPYRVDPKGLSYLEEANKVLKKSGFSSLFSSSNKYEDGRELLQKAAAQFKIAKNWQEAGDTYFKSGEIAEKNLKELFDASSDYTNAAKAYKNVNGEQAAKAYRLAINLHMEGNKFSSAARLWKELGELEEKNLNVSAAAHCYEKAADCFEAEDSKANASSCWVKVADLALEQEEYARAVEIYEKVAAACADNSGMRWSVKDYLFKALLCQFALASSSPRQELEPVRKAVEKYLDLLPQLDGTRELKLVQTCLDHFEQDNVDAFTDAVFDYDSVYKLDDLIAKTLLEIKKNLQNGPSTQGKVSNNLDFTGSSQGQETEEHDFT